MQPPAAKQRRVLDTVRVLDFSIGLAGPYCTRQMCDLGAEVIKVEPPTGDPTRSYPFVTPSGDSGYFMQQNWGKK
jgi:crotonobetainyl-CoA:carnitine CoA-transferase CaiB-like acyl-CoA transferase